MVTLKLERNVLSSTEANITQFPRFILIIMYKKTLLSEAANTSVENYFLHIFVLVCTVRNIKNFSGTEAETGRKT